ncbi:helix-turn-helix transcriptional regulator [Planctomycetota bacterium]
MPELRPKEFYTVMDLVEMTGLSRGMLHYLIGQGNRFPMPRKIGGVYSWPAAEVEVVINAVKRHQAEADRV